MDDDTPGSAAAGASSDAPLCGDDEREAFPAEAVDPRTRSSAARTAGRLEGADALLKHDFVRGSTESRSFGPQKALGEFVFHPSSPDAAEDDGLL